MWRVLFRLWIIGAVIWIGFAILAGNGDSRPNAFEIYFWAAMVPPVAVLSLGAAIRWAFSP